MPTPDLDNASVLVTGGAGFIGSHLARRLLQTDIRELRLLDNMRYADPAHLRDLLDDPRVRLETFDLGRDDPAALTPLLTGVDYLFHLAAEKHNQSLDAPRAVLQVNVSGMLHLLQAAMAAAVKKVVFSSSLYAYGRRHPPRMVETDLPVPDTVYGVSKVAGEHLLAWAAREGGLRATVLRFFFVYGPMQFGGQGYKSVIVKTFERLLAGEAPVVFGDGQQALDYIYVDDVTDAVVRALAPDADGEIYNVASGTATPVLDLVRTMQTIAGNDAAPAFAAPDATAGTSRAGDPGKIRDALGWQATTTLTDGLQRTWTWMQQHPQR